MQVKLLRAIQEKRIRPVGSQQEHAIDVRIISATHKNLAKLVESGEFRQDLYYRVNVIELPMPPLRERIDDIPLLTQHFLTQMVDGTEKKKPRLSANALNKLQCYSFPGNIRELENIIERSVTLLDGDLLEEKDLNLPTDEKDTTHDDSSTSLLDHKMEQIERDAIIKALESTRWNKTAAAKKLGMTLRSLRYRLAKYGID
jgi:two-component system response regulator PilR (NtrC family)